MLVRRAKCIKSEYVSLRNINGKQKHSGKIIYCDQIAKVFSGIGIKTQYTITEISILYTHNIMRSQ